MEMLDHKFDCPANEIAAYIDGELDVKHERELDAHFAQCSICTDELNLQKQFLCHLDSILKHGSDLTLPADFTKTVVANAESTVAGLRRPKERFNAVFICAGLALFVLFASGADAARFAEGVTAIFDQGAAVGSFFGHLVYSFFIGVLIVVRALASQVRFDLAAALVLTVLALLPLTLVSRKVLRMRRA